MIKFIILGIIIATFLITFFIICRDNKYFIEISKTEDQEKLEKLKTVLVIKIQSLDDKTEIAKLEKHIAAIDAKLETININS